MHKPSLPALERNLTKSLNTGYPATCAWRAKFYLACACLCITGSNPSAGNAPAGTTDVDLLHALAAQASAERIEADARTLVGFGTRHTLSETLSDSRGIGAARRWIFDEFQAISKACRGSLEVLYIGDTIAGINGVINNTTARVFSEGTRDVETPEEAKQRRFTGGEVDSPSRNIARYIDRMADQYRSVQISTYRI